MQELPILFKITDQDTGFFLQEMKEPTRSLVFLIKQPKSRTYLKFYDNHSKTCHEKEVKDPNMQLKEN